MLSTRLMKSASAAIFVGMFIGGLGQIVMATAADKFLNDQDFVALMTWNSLFGLISLLVGSPLVSLIIVKAANSDGVAEIDRLEGAALTIGLTVSIVASIGWRFGGGSFGTENSTLPLLLLFVSPFYQVCSASQRGMLASESRWLGVSFQLAFEGLSRGSLIVLFGMLNVRSSNFMIFLSWISPILAVEITFRFFRLRRPTFKPMAIEKSIFKLFIPLWISSAAMHLILTLTPNLMSLRTQNVLAIGAISLGLFILRIPLTLSSTVFTPLIGPMSRSISHKIAISLIKKTLLLCSIFTTFIVPASVILGPMAAGLISDNQLLASPRLLGLLGFSSGLFLLAAALHTFLLARELMLQITIGWGLTALFFFGAMILSGNNEQSVAVIVALSALIAVVSLGWGAINRVRVIVA